MTYTPFYKPAWLLVNSYGTTSLQQLTSPAVRYGPAARDSPIVTQEKAGMKGCPPTRGHYTRMRSWGLVRRRIGVGRQAMPKGLVRRGRIALLLQPHLFQRRGPRIGINQHQCGLLDARPDAAWPIVVPDRPKPYPLMEQLLDLVQQGLPLAAVGLHRLLLVKCIDVGIA